jgi:hypothetical protein
MTTTEILISEIQSKFQKETAINGHFSAEIHDLGNNKFGLDIFTFEHKKSKEGLEKILLASVYKKGVIRLLEHMGVCYKTEQGESLLVIKEHNIISEITLKEVKDLINEYLNQLPAIEVTLGSVSTSFTSDAQVELIYRQANLVLNESFLEFIYQDLRPIIKDTTGSSSLFFDNGIIKVKPGDSVEKMDYRIYPDGLVWKNNIIDFQISNRDSDQCHYSEFIENVCGGEPERILSLRSAIGYLLHAFNRRSGGQMVLLYDESITDTNNPQGGTGKGIIANSIALLRSTVKIDGKKLKGDNRFDYQDVTHATNLLWIDDVGKQLDIDTLNSVSTDGFNIEKKFKDSFYIKAEDSPKILICSNIILDCGGTTRKRRQFIIELSDFYSSKIKTGAEEPIVDEHGCRFFTKDWANDEWNRFYWFMIDCLQLYLDKGLIPFESINVIENRLRQTIGEDFLSWLTEKDFKIDTNYPTQELLEEYKKLFENDNSQFTQRKFSNHLKQYFSLKNKEVSFSSESKNGVKVSFFRIRN